MAQQDSSAPIHAGERAAVARFLEAARDALDDDRLRMLDRVQLGGHLVTKLDEAALCVRRGYLEVRLDTLAGEVDRYRADLADKAAAPEGNPADPFIAGRPIGNSGP